MTVSNFIFSLEFKEATKDIIKIILVSKWEALVDLFKLVNFIDINMIQSQKHRYNRNYVLETETMSDSD